MLDIMENGTISRTTNFKDGKLHGERVWYYENGKIRKKEIYKDGKLIK